MLENTELHINPGHGAWTLEQDEEQQIVLIFDDACTTLPRELIFNLKGKGASLNIIGIILLRALPLKGRNHLRVRLKVAHYGADTKSRVDVVSVLGDSAGQDVDGMIQIKKGAKGADSALSHRTLTLSSLAKSVTVPSLEIEEDDVKASHAGTTGPIDPEQLFYLQSRGLKSEEAQQVIAQGFLGQVIEKIKDEEVRENVSKLLFLDVIPAPYHGTG